MDHFEIQPATPERWVDLVDLFERPGPRGGKTVTSGCWCMYWRLPRPAFDRNWGKGATRGLGNKAEFQGIIETDRQPGVLAYHDGDAVGGCSIGPREEFVRLEASPALQRVDDAPVWSIVCFYIHSRFRKRGVGSALIKGAVEHARAHGATIVEAYPSKPGDSDPYTGLESMFAAAGFRQVRAGERRSIWRLLLTPEP